MKMHKRALIWILSACLVLSGSACGKKPDDTTSLTETQATVTTSSATSTTTAGSTATQSETKELPLTIDEICFGSLYGEPIEWLVVDQNENGYLLLSKYLLAARPYNEKYDGVTWETCSLRKWLNEDFFTRIFNEEERKQVITTKLQVADNADYGTPGGNATEDALFLLSLDEVARYLPTPDDRKCTPTQKALDDKIWVSETGTCYWWLITPGFDEYNACMIDTSGFIGRMGYRVHNRNMGIRPAFWLKADSVDKSAWLTPFED